MEGLSMLRIFAFLLCVGAFWTSGLSHAYEVAILEAERNLREAERTASVVYVTPTGTGTQTGESDINSISFTTFWTHMPARTTSTRYRFLAGTYSITSSRDIRAPNGGILSLDAAPGVQILGNLTFSPVSGQSNGFRLRTGNIIIRGFTFEMIGTCARTESTSTVQNVIIENITANNTHSCILVDRGMTMPIGNWVIRNVNINGYNRVGVRLASVQSSGFLIEDTVIDGAQSQGPSDCFKGGIQILTGASNITVRHTEVRNNIGTCAVGAYEQGDGIEVDHVNGIPTNILFEDVLVENSRDGEFDLKGENITLKDITVRSGPVSRFPLKFWHYDNYQCHNCVLIGGAGTLALIHSVYATMVFHNSVILNDRPQRLCDNRHENGPAVIQFNNDIIYVGSSDPALRDTCGEGVLDNARLIPFE